MKKLSPILRTIFGCFCITLFLSTQVISQTQPSAENDRKIRYITTNKKSIQLKPRVRIIKKNPISRKPGSGLRKLIADDQNLEKKAFDLINKHRVEKGLKQLEWSDKLASLARQHSENMAKHTFFSHVGLNGRLIDQRAIDFGIKNWNAIGENIAFNKGFKEPANFAVERWMLSVTHRNNLLDTRWTESGIGVGITQDGFYYFTQVFLVK